MVPRLPSPGAVMTWPVSPTMASREIPALVRSAMNGLKNLNHMKVSHPERMAHTKSCQERSMPGTKKSSAAMMRAPSPNHRTVMLPRKSSAMSRTIPPMSQCQYASVTAM